MSRFPTLRRASSAVAVAVAGALLGPGSAPAVAQAPPVPVDIPTDVQNLLPPINPPLPVPELPFLPGFSYVQSLTPMQGSAVQMQQGKVLGPKACEFVTNLNVPSGQQAIEQREVAINIDTCQILLETGVPNPASLASYRQGKRLSSSSAQARSRGRGADVRSAARAVHSAGYFKTVWEDPVEIDVTSVRNNTDWHWTGSRVVRPVRGRRGYGWFSASGWQLNKGSNWRNYFTSYQTTSSSFVRFHNDAFCRAVFGIFGTTTHVVYDRNTVHGRKNGDLVGKVRTRKYGGCSKLLHFDKYLVRTKN